MTATAVTLASAIAREFEGCHLEPYHCPAGYPTIGWGRLLSRKRGDDLSNYDPCTQLDADLWLLEDMGRAELSVDRLITCHLSAGQKAALMDFAYNLGGGNLQASTLRKVVNRGNYAAAPKQFRRWCYAGGVRMAGLLRRREAEIEAWEQ